MPVEIAADWIFSCHCGECGWRVRICNMTLGEAEKEVCRPKYGGKILMNCDGKNRTYWSAKHYDQDR